MLRCVYTNMLQDIACLLRSKDAPCLTLDVQREESRAENAHKRGAGNAQHNPQDRHRSTNEIKSTINTLVGTPTGNTMNVI